MLAPLQDRSILEADPGDPQNDEMALLLNENRDLKADNQALRSALRQSRQAQQRSINASTAQVIRQANEINRLREINQHQAERLAGLESSPSIIQLGQKLMALTSQNEILAAAAQRICILDKALCLARRECEYIVEECEIAFIQINAQP